MAADEDASKIAKCMAAMLHQQVEIIVTGGSALTPAPALAMAATESQLSSAISSLKNGQDTSTTVGGDAPEQTEVADPKDGSPSRRRRFGMWARNRRGALANGGVLMLATAALVPVPFVGAGAVGAVLIGVGSALVGTVAATVSAAASKGGAEAP